MANDVVAVVAAVVWAAVVENRGQSRCSEPRLRHCVASRGEARGGVGTAAVATFGTIARLQS